MVAEMVKNGGLLSGVVRAALSYLLERCQFGKNTGGGERNLAAESQLISMDSGMMRKCSGKTRGSPSN